MDAAPSHSHSHNDDTHSHSHDSTVSAESLSSTVARGTTGSNAGGVGLRFPSATSSLPPTPAVAAPAPAADTVYLSKKLTTVEDLDSFVKSATFETLIAFVQRLGTAVHGVKTTDSVLISPVVEKTVQLLEKLLKWIEEIPPSESISRFGNSAFRTWHARLVEHATKDVTDLFDAAGRSERTEVEVGELVEYLLHSFGDAQRIDYGTGHETHFAAFMLCGEKLGLYTSADYPAMVTRMFATYLTVMRKLQVTYWLEPAGSHGVWGLDDYHFLIFLWGAAQLVDHKHLSPNSINQRDIVDAMYKDYLYFAGIHFVNQVKTEALPWHSPMLYDISAVKTWQKVFEGLVKMYRAEVLSKQPIMQHFLFGTLLPFTPVSTNTGDQAATIDHHGHTHAAGALPDCCISRVPSIFAAKLEQQKKIPFD